MDKTTFVNRAIKIQNTIEYLDKISDIMGVDLWDTPMADPINVAIETLAENLGIIKGRDLEIFFNTFWVKNENKDWNLFYDGIMTTTN